MEVHDSARKHGIADADIAHAITHHLYAGDIADNESPPWRVLYLGPCRAGNLLEVVVSNATWHGVDDPRDEDAQTLRGAVAQKSGTR